MALGYGSTVIYELVVTLEDVQPPVWRRLQVPAEITLADLHRVLQVAMGWADTHLHQFVIAGELIGVPDPEISRPLTDESKVRLVDVTLAKTQFAYEYDFGDMWRHTVVVDRVLHDVDGEVRCLDGARACPPEDSGGWAGYDELCDILTDPRRPEHSARLASLGGAFDPEAFALGETNDRLHRQSPLAIDQAPAASMLLH